MKFICCDRRAYHIVTTLKYRDWETACGEVLNPPDVVVPVVDVGSGRDGGIGVDGWDDAVIEGFFRNDERDDLTRVALVEFLEELLANGVADTLEVS